MLHIFTYYQEASEIERRKCHTPKPHATIIGKGNKIRTLYLLLKVVAHLEHYMKEFYEPTFSDYSHGLRPKMSARALTVINPGIRLP